MRIAGLPDLRTRSANARSAGVAPARASIRNSTASAAEIAASVCSCMRLIRLSGAASSSPAVSMAVMARSPSCARPSRRSRVTPGTWSTNARRLPTRRLNSVDLPTFGRPTMATVKLMAKGSALWTPLYARRQRRVQSARRGRILDLLARLIALDHFLRHALRHPWRSLREHCFAFPRQPLLGVEKIRVHEARRIEAFTTRKQDAERQSQDGEAIARETIHAAPLNCGPRRHPAPSAFPRGSAWRQVSAHPS